MQDDANLSCGLLIRLLRLEDEDEKLYYLVDEAI